MFNSLEGKASGYIVRGLEQLTFLSCFRKSGDKGISSWDWNLSGQHSTYHALFPRAWTVYDGTVILKCCFLYNFVCDLIWFIYVFWLLDHLWHLIRVSALDFSIHGVILLVCFFFRWTRSRAQNIMSTNFSIYTSQL